MMSGMAVPPDDHSEIVGVRGADDSERDGLVVPLTKRATSARLAIG